MHVSFYDTKYADICYSGFTIRIVLFQRPGFTDCQVFFTDCDLKAFDAAYNEDSPFSEWDLARDIYRTICSMYEMDINSSVSWENFRSDPQVSQLERILKTVMRIAKPDMGDLIAIYPGPTISVPNDITVVPVAKALPL